MNAPLFFMLASVIYLASTLTREDALWLAKLHALIAGGWVIIDKLMEVA